jgi:hypothetical protein
MGDGEQSGYVTYNELIRFMEAFLQPSFTTSTVADPPGSPAEGQMFLVPESGGTGAWAGNEGKIAQWYNAQWVFYDVPTGYDVHDQEDGLRWTTGVLDPYIGHVSVGHAGLVLDTTIADGQDITEAGVKLTDYDSKWSPSVDAQASLASSDLTWTQSGFWVMLISYTGAVTADAGNRTRHVEFYLYNDTDGVELDPIAAVPIPRYSDRLTASIVAMVGVDSGLVNKKISLRARSLVGDGTIVVGDLYRLEFSTYRISHTAITPSLVTSD